MTTLPRLLAVLLRLAIRPDLLEHALGDLEEGFARRTAAHGAGHARRWCWREGLRLAAAVPRWSGAAPARAAAIPAAEGEDAVRSFGRDLRYGWRALAKNPGYSIVAVATLALAIGANTVIFSFANVLLFRPLPIADPPRVAFVYSTDPHGSPRGRASFADYQDLRDRSSSFDALAAWTDASVTLTGHGDPQRLLARRVTPNLFDAWGLQPAAGRLLRSGEDEPGAACTVVLSDRLWASMFQRNPAVVSTAIGLDGQSCTIVGVITAAIEIGNLSLIDVWMPVAAEAMTAPRDARAFGMSGHLKAGVTVERAAADLKVIADRLQHEHPDTNSAWSVRVLPTKSAMLGENSWIIFDLLLLVVGLVLLIACANIANLMLARATARRRELAVRVALGATRTAVVRQMVAESLTIGVTAGACGVAIAEAGLRLIRAAAYEPFFVMVAIDRYVLGFALILSVVAPLLFSVLPAMHAASAAFADGLRTGDGRTGASAAARRSRSTLVVAQVSLAIVLLVIAGLVTRTLIALNHLNLGFDPRPLLTAQINLPEWKYKADTDAIAFYERLADRLERAPGVMAAGAVTGLPTLTFGTRVQFEIAGRAAPTPDDRPWGHQFVATPGYPAAAGIPLVRGRWFARGDREAAALLVVVNAEAARRYWRSLDDAVGARVRVMSGGDPAWAEVIGVLGNVANPDPNQPPLPSVFLSALQRPPRTASIVVRAARPEETASALRAAVHDADRDVPVFQLRSMRIALDDEMSSQIILSSLFVAFAVLALTLATAGLYGVISFAVGQRTREIGVRIALGAVPRDIRRLVVAQALGLVAIGGAIGLAAAALVAQTLSRVLFGVTPLDPLTYASVVAVVTASATAAAWVPAERAIRLDPVRSLKTE